MPGRSAYPISSSSGKRYTNTSTKVIFLSNELVGCTTKPEGLCIIKKCGPWNTMSKPTGSSLIFCGAILRLAGKVTVTISPSLRANPVFCANRSLTITSS